jgi:hypothetical protein
MNKFVKKLFEEIKGITIPLYKILIPFVFIIKLLEISGVIELTAKAIEPIMNLIGLTPELGLVFVTAFLVNIYASLVLFVNLLPGIDVTVAQITILTTMMLIAHNLPIESTISRAAGVNFFYTIILRLISAFILGFILKTIYFNFNLLNNSFTTFFSIKPPPQDIILWFWDQFLNLVYIFLIVVTVTTLLEILRLVGIEKLFEKIFVPPLKLFGIEKEAMNIILVGMTIGLQFGGGILIREVKKGVIDKKSAFLSISMLNLMHALIEDTILMALVGGHISGIFFARIIFSLLMCFLILKAYNFFNLKTDTQ